MTVDRQEQEYFGGASVAVTGTFATREQASEAVDHLIAAGVEAGAISVVGPSGKAAELSETPAEQIGDFARDTGVGALIGIVAGIAASAILVPGLGAVLAAGPLVVGGALAGGLVGALRHLGFSGEHAEYLTEQVKAGRYLVIVHLDQGSQGAGGTQGNANLANVETALMNAGAQETRVSAGA